MTRIIPPLGIYTSEQIEAMFGMKERLKMIFLLAAFTMFGLYLLLGSVVLPGEVRTIGKVVSISNGRMLVVYEADGKIENVSMKRPFREEYYDTGSDIALAYNHRDTLDVKRLSSFRLGFSILTFIVVAGASVEIMLVANHRKRFSGKA